MADLQENMVVADRFRLVRMIGRGGMGSVWQAMHLGLDTPCAVKFIEGELANVAEAHARFEREAKAAAQLRSPNVVQIFDHGVWQGRPYIAMELLEGEDLGKRLANRGGRLTPPEVNFVIQQVCRALSRAHQAGVVHRDLKPDNIFIVKDDDRDIVKILDFGVAKSASQTLDGSNTKTGAMLGTPYYMSPEQAQGIKSVDSRSDLWSLAVIVYQCITGRLPFESEALGDLLVKIIVSPIPTPSVTYPMAPLGFDTWWAKAADRNPDNRYPTAKAFAESLSMSLGQSSVTEITERGRLNRPSEKPGTHTAMMVNSPATEVFAHAPNTPQPGAHTAAMATPNPMHTPPGMQAPGMGSSPGQHGVPGGPPPGHPGYAQAPQVTTGNPVAQTFSGLDAGMPKKGVPIAVYVGIGLLAVVGLGLGGFAFVKGRSGTAAGSGDPAGSGAVASASAGPAAISTAVATAEPSGAKPTDTPPDLSAAGGAKDPATPPSASASASAAAVAVAPAGGGVHRPVVGVAPHTATPAVKPPVVAAQPPPPATAAKPGVKPPPKPNDLGF
jgi:serine/threonine-protein kinase